MQNFPEAIEAKRKALELLPGSPDLRFELGKVFMMAQEYEAAIPELEGVEDLPGSWKTQILLGNGARGGEHAQLLEAIRA